MFLGYIDPGTGFTIFGAGAWIAAFLLGFFGLFSLFFKKIISFLNKHKKIIISLICPVLIIFLIIIGVTMHNKKPSFGNKIIILGFDGLSPEIIERMMQEGKLPNFTALKNLGSYRRLSTTNPPQSPVAWSGFATGKNPGKHNIFDFIVRDPKDYSLSLSLSKMHNGKPQKVIREKCFWQYTSENNIPVTILSCPVTFPPDKLSGRMLSGMGVPDILGTEGTFTFYTSEKQNDTTDVAGKVFQVRKSHLLVLNLIGPRVSGFGKKARNLQVPFKVALGDDPQKVSIELQGKNFEIYRERWSQWQEVSFDAGLFKKIKGIFKFYLVQTQPEFKLYISPINFDPRAPFFQISYPKDYSRELAGKLGLYFTQGMPMDTWAVNESRLPETAFIEEAEEIFKDKQAQLDYELKRQKNGILFCYFEGSDIIQHMFWRYIDPRHPLYEKDAPAEYKEMIETWYKKLDTVLGNAAKQLGPEDTLIALSDHGFNTFRRTVHLNSWLRENGYLQLKDEQSAQGAELLRDIDWSRTRAYAIGFGSIYINQKGREADGIVQPGEESERLKKEISQKLRAWSDDKYNQPIVSRVYPKEEIFWGKFAPQTPELYVGFNIGYRASWQTALGAVPAGLIEDNLKKWSGDHLFDPGLVPGVIFSNKKITVEAPSIYDLAPTLLKITGKTADELKELEFDGKVLF